MAGPRWRNHVVVVVCTAASALPIFGAESDGNGDSLSPPSVNVHAGTSCPRSNPAATVGELRGDIAILKSFYTAPSDLESGNHIFDMWAERSLPRLLQATGLTNNRALLVNAHGKRITTALGPRYAYHPHESLMKRASGSVYFTIGDVAAVMGARNAATIHNVILAGCDRERAFRSAEVRQHFPNATNIVHVPAGAEGYQPMFLQSLLIDSDGISTAYQVRHVNGFGKPRYEIVADWQPGATRLSPYIAELFRPGERKPFRVQTAGRELLTNHKSRAGFHPALDRQDACPTLLSQTALAKLAH